LAGSLFSLLSWWVQHGMTPPPVEMDKLFHQLVWTGADWRPADKMSDS
jgi:hypothetical protein